jgi:predicted nucleotidyltransferase
MYSVKEIKEKLQPVFEDNLIERAVLFGSYAKGTQLPTSDVDILIDSNGKIRGIDFFGVLGDVVDTLKMPVDLIEASQIVEGGRIQQEINETGVLIYERTRKSNPFKN